MVRRTLLLALAAAGGAAAAQAQTDLPPEIAAFTAESLAACREAGGNPSLQGLSFPGAGTTAEVFVPYLTEAELNGDGRTDYVTDLAGLECENAWSYFCGSAGCPVTAWLSGRDGYAAVPAGNVQSWERRGTELVLSVHGQLCAPPRAGADSCEIVMRFEGQSGTVGDEPPASDPAAPSQAEATASAPETSLRPPPRPLRPGEEEAAAVEPEPEAPAAAEPEPVPPVAEAPAAQAPGPPPVGWTFGPVGDGAGFYARVTDAETGVQVDWLCAKGEPTRLAVSPFPGGEMLGIDVGGRVESFPVTIKDGVAYAEAGIVSPLFLHMASGPTFALTDGAGTVLGRFPFEGAPAAIGQAEGRCRI